MGQDICQNQHESSGFIEKHNPQLKVTTLYYNQESNKASRRYDRIKNSHLYNMLSSDSSSQDNSRLNQNILQQMQRDNVQLQAYAKTQAELLNDLNLFVHSEKDKSGMRKNTKLVADSTLQRVVEKKKKQLGQFQNNLGNTDAPTGSFINQYHPLKNKIIYRGQWLKPEDTDKSTSVQIFQNDQIHGKGQYFLPDHTYIQAFAQHNKINGYGRLININGDYYEGQFENNKANGIGRYCQGDIFYNGGFKDNLPHGNGQECTELYTFIGQFENGYRKKGKLTWKNKKDDSQVYVYEGQFTNNTIKPNGKLRINGQLASYEHFHIK